MLKKLINPTNKKIKIARKVYETYCQTKSLLKTHEATGLAVGTIRRYIVLAEDLNNTNRISSKDRYYNSKEDINDNIAAPPPYDSTYDNDINNICQEGNKNISEIDIKEEIQEIKNSEDNMDVILANKISPLNDIKKKLFIGKLNTAAEKYVDVLINADENKLKRTSLKDAAIIAGVLIDKQVQLTHKDADVIKNQSIIFNLFGDNNKLAEFIANNMARQKALRERPVNKYIPAVNK